MKDIKQTLQAIKQAPAYSKEYDTARATFFCFFGLEYALRCSPVYRKVPNTETGQLYWQWQYNKVSARNRKTNKIIRPERTTH